MATVVLTSVWSETLTIIDTRSELDSLAHSFLSAQGEGGMRKSEIVTKHDRSTPRCGTYYNYLKSCLLSLMNLNKKLTNNICITYTVPNN